MVPNRRKKSLHSEIKRHVAAGSAVCTDALMSYQDLKPTYAHQVIDHAERYVDGQVHTNGLKNFWSLLKRGIKGTYVSVEPFHLFRYLDEDRICATNEANGSVHPWPLMSQCLINAAEAGQVEWPARAPRQMFG